MTQKIENFNVREAAAYLRKSGRSVGELFITTKSMEVFIASPHHPFRHISTLSRIPAETIFLVTKHTKPMEDYQHDVVGPEGRFLKTHTEYIGISYCTEILIGDMYRYVWDQDWLRARLSGTVCYLEE